jgi:hypothetical protein
MNGFDLRYFLNFRISTEQLCSIWKMKLLPTIREGILKSKNLRIERDNVLAEQRRKSDSIQNRFCENRQTICRLLHPIVLLPIWS